MKIEFLTPGSHADAYNDLSWNKRRKTKHNVEESLARVEAHIGDRLELPRKINVAFTDRRSYQAQVSGGWGTPRLDISITAGGYRLFGREEGLDGLMGHETSHLSDIVTGNNCAYNSGRRDRAVSEGKAMHLGVEIGGDEYHKPHTLGVRDGVEKKLAYDKLLGRNRVRALLSVLGVSRAGAGVDLEQVERATNPYKVGYTLVGDVMGWVGVGNVVDIHAQPVEFFVDTAKANHR